MIFGGANFKWNLQQFSVDVEIMIAFFLKSLFIVEKLRYQHFPLETLEECHLIWEGAFVVSRSFMKSGTNMGTSNIKHTCKVFFKFREFGY